MIQFARQVARDASKISVEDVNALKNRHGFTDAEVFDIAAIAASRSFFTKLLDALGVFPDRNFLKLDEELRHALTVGRTISHKSPQYLDDDWAA